MDRKTKKVTIFELTVPSEQRIVPAHTLKEQSYHHFEADIKSFTATVVPFEVGSHTAFISKDNRTRLNLLHKYCKKNIKLKNFLNNISAVGVLGSYYIFNCRDQVLWADITPILISEKVMNIHP